MSYLSPALRVHCTGKRLRLGSHWCGASAGAPAAWPLAGLLACALAPAWAQTRVPDAPALDLPRQFSLSLAMAARGPADADQTAAAARATRWADVLQSSLTAAANRVADAGVQGAMAQERQAWATAWMPRLDASANGARQKQTYNGLDGDAPASSVSLVATLPLWHAAERATAQAQQAQTQQAQWQAQAQRMSVARQASLAYVAGAQAAQEARLGQAQIEVLDVLSRMHDRRLSAGVGTVLDQLETATRAQQVRAAVQEARMRVRSQQLLLERLCGRAIQVPAGLADPGNGAGDDASSGLPTLEEAQARASADSPELQQARAEVQAAQATARARSAEFWQPTVDANASASRVRQTQRFDGVSELQDVHTRGVGVQINWPLYSGGYQSGRTQEAQAGLERAQARQDDAQSALNTGLQDAYQSLRQARAMVQAQHAVGESARATYEALRKAFEAGTRSNLDLLNAQQQIYAAAQAETSARATALNARIQILAWLGELDAEHVGHDARQFDPQAFTAP